MAQHASIGQPWPIDRTAANSGGLRHSDVTVEQSSHLQPLRRVIAKQQRKRDIASNFIEERYEIDDLAQRPARNLLLDDDRDLRHQAVDDGPPKWRKHHAAIVAVAAAIH